MDNSARLQRGLDMMGLMEDAQLLEEWRYTPAYEAFKRRYDELLADRTADVLNASAANFPQAQGRYLGVREVMQYIEAVVDQSRRARADAVRRG